MADITKIRNKKTGTEYDIKDSVARERIAVLEENQLVAGENIKIEGNVISASGGGTEYVAGTGIEISEDNVISATGGSGTSYTAGEGIKIKKYSNIPSEISVNEDVVKYETITLHDVNDSIIVEEDGTEWYQVDFGEFGVNPNFPIIINFYNSHGTYYGYFDYETDNFVWYSVDMELIADNLFWSGGYLFGGYVDILKENYLSLIYKNADGQIVLDKTTEIVTIKYVSGKFSIGCRTAEL